MEISEQSAFEKRGAIEVMNLKDTLYIRREIIKIIIT